MADADDPALRAYVAPGAPPKRVAHGARDMLTRATFSGAACGALVGALDGLPYYVAHHHDVAFDWTVTAIVYEALSVATGAFVGLGTAAGILLGDRLVRRFREDASGQPLTALVGATMGGAILGILPGAVATMYFGSRQAPFFGTAALAVGPLAGILVISALVASADHRRGGGDEVRGPGFGVFLGYALQSLIPLAIVGGALTAYVDDETALRWMRHVAWGMKGPSSSPPEMPPPDVRDLAMGLGILGVGLGVALGAMLGLHVGTTTALARWRARHARTGSRPLTTSR
jgi:hypothetical protein